jgi:hypothetical protein
MGQNILVTAGAGYMYASLILSRVLSDMKHSGGSIVADFISRTSGPIKEATISTTVRSDEQVQALSNLGINVIKLDLSDKQAVLDAVLGNESRLTFIRETGSRSSHSSQSI